MWNSHVCRLCKSCVSFLLCECFGEDDSFIGIPECFEPELYPICDDSPFLDDPYERFL